MGPETITPGRRGKPADLLARFRADARWARVPVVVTGTGDPAAPKQFLNVDGFLAKPFDAEKLVSLGRQSIALRPLLGRS